jgi:hypothetical protein
LIAAAGSPYAGPARADSTAKLEACRKLDALTIPGFEFNSKVSLVGDVASWLKDNPRLAATELQTKVMTLGASKGVLVIKPGEQAAAAASAAAAGVSGMGGFNPFAAAMNPMWAMMLGSAVMPNASTAVTVPPAAAPAVQPAVQVAAAMPSVIIIIIIMNPCMPYLTASAPRLTHWGCGK